MPLMTLIIELLPAPLGPMMARISCSRTLKDTSAKALMPPKDREIFCKSSITTPILRAGWCPVCSGGAVVMSLVFMSAPAGQRSWPRQSSNQPQSCPGDRLQISPASRCTAIAGLHTGPRSIPRISRQQSCAALCGCASTRRHRGPTPCARSENDESANRPARGLAPGRCCPSRCTRPPIDRRSDAPPDRCSCHRPGVPLRPVAHGIHVDIDEGRALLALVAEGNGLLDEGEKLQLVLDILGREHGAASHLADILG